MKVFNVLKPGFLTTIQDLGRYGFLKYGVPISGAMDSFSLTAANLLVGNSPNDAGLEITLIGPELQALSSIQFAMTGGVTSPKINGKDVPMWQTLRIREDEILSFGKMESGCRAYLAVKGGINVPLVLGSRSTYFRGRLGGIDGRQLKTGDIIEVFEAQPLKFEYRMPEEFVPHFTNHFKAHVVLGPQVDMFTEEAVATFLHSPYKVTLEADRMGYRLEGSIIEHRGKADIVSDALLPGAIQVPQSGKPILIMRDAQTTGGYPKIAVVISPDLSMLGQAKPNDIMEFHGVTLEQAHRKLREYCKLLQNLDSMLVRSPNSL